MHGFCMLTTYAQGIGAFQMRSVGISRELTIKVLTVDREVRSQMVFTWSWLSPGPERSPKWFSELNVKDRGGQALLLL